MGALCQVVVNNCPKDCLEYIVARWSNDSGLWFWGSWDNEKQANEVAKTIGGIVVRRIGNESV